MSSSQVTSRRFWMPDRTSILADELLMEQIDRGSRVIDLGCGDGRLLARLRDDHDCFVQGVELNLSQVYRGVARGVPVIRADLDEGIPDIPTGAFDFAVLSETLQQTRHPRKLLVEMMRVAKRALVVVPNFGYWQVRLTVLLRGRTPITNALPYEWYETPNLHFMSMHDFRALAAQLNLAIILERPIIGGRPVDRAWLANLRSDSVLYVLERS